MLNLQGFILRGRRGSNPQPSDRQSERVVITIVFARSYMRVLRQKSGLQVVDKSTYKSLTTQYTLLTDELFAEHFRSTDCQKGAITSE